MGGHIKNVAVFCGSREGNDPAYMKMAYELGKNLAEKGFGIVYGGGDSGLMGAVGKAAHEAGGKVYGVTTRFFDDAQGETFGTKVVAPNMFTRKRKMLRLAQAAISLPGGYGTLDEDTDTICDSDISVHNNPRNPIKPCILVNYGGFYEGMRLQFLTCAAAGFTGKGTEALHHFVPDIEQAVWKILELNNKPALYMRDFKKSVEKSNIPECSLVVSQLHT